MPKKHFTCSINFTVAILKGWLRFQAKTPVVVNAGDKGLYTSFFESQNETGPSIVIAYAKPWLTSTALFIVRLLVKAIFNSHSPYQTNSLVRSAHWGVAAESMVLTINLLP